MDTKQAMTVTVTGEEIVDKIFIIRGQKVMLDKDLAEMYGVELRSLNQAVKRNIQRFPEDFMFQLTKEENQSLRSQFVILDNGRGKYSKFLPYAFTEQGVAMLSSVLRSETAIQVNIQIIRVFTKMKRPPLNLPQRGRLENRNISNITSFNLKFFASVFAHSFPRWGKIDGGRGLYI